jgi:nucleotide-binding universal stress UspA family protein
MIVHAFIQPAGSIPANWSPNPVYETREQADLLVEHAAGRLREMGVSEVMTEIVEGPAVNVIIGAAENYQPDILIIGARGQSLWPGSQLGSVSSAVAQRAECPVLVVK